MGAKRLNYRLAKIHRSYTVGEIAELYQVHDRTVRNWIKVGLPTCDNNRPTLILGQALRDFLHARRTKNKQSCKAGEIFCVRCRSPKSPAEQMAEYQSITENVGNLIGICPVCHGLIYRRASFRKLTAIRGDLDITFTNR